MQALNHMNLALVSSNVCAYTRARLKRELTLSTCGPGCSAALDRLRRKQELIENPLLFGIKLAFSSPVVGAPVGGAAKTHYSTLARIQVCANTAEQAQEGGCAEYAAVAFIHLYRQYPKVRPLDYIESYLPSDIKHNNHAFVLIGSPVVPTESNMAKWKTEAHVCDPFFSVWTIASLAKNTIKPGWVIRSGCRILS